MNVQDETDEPEGDVLKWVGVVVAGALCLVCAAGSILAVVHVLGVLGMMVGLW